MAEEELGDGEPAGPTSPGAEAGAGEEQAQAGGTRQCEGEGEQSSAESSEEEPGSSCEEEGELEEVGLDGEEGVGTAADAGRATPQVAEQLLEGGAEVIGVLATGEASADDLDFS